MPQNPLVRSPLAVSYLTSMSRPDAALALAAIHGFEAKRQSRAGAICVAGAGLGAAIFCDIVGRFYTVGPVPNANDVLPIGLDVVSPLPPDSPMVRGVIERKNEKGEPTYPRSIRKVTDTSQAEAMLRNGITLQRETTLVISAPADTLARMLALQGVKDLLIARVKRLIVVDAGVPQPDVAAMRKVLRDWPTQVVLCGREVGQSLIFPGASLMTEFAWSDANPVADAYRAFKAMPYDAPSYDLAAVHYASKADSGFFKTSSGTINVSDDGRLSFAAGSGTATAISVEPSKRAELLQELIAAASTRPTAPRASRPPV